MSSATLPTLQLSPSRGTGGLIETARSLDQLYNYGRFLIDSGMIPRSIATPQAAVAIMLKGDELGIKPMHAFTSISVIQGNPTISPQLMLALVERTGLLEDIQVVEDKDSCQITMKRRGRSAQAVRFDRAEAVAMGLAGKDNWKKQFGVMMYWRCVTKACRRVFPDVIAGCYSPDEMGATINEDGELIDAEVVEMLAGPPVPTAKGLFSKEHVARTAAFTDWLSKQCQRINDAWHDGDGKGWAGWKATLEAAMDEGHGVPSKVGDLMPFWQARGHLFKWAQRVGYIEFPPGVDPEEAKTRQADAYCALVFHEHKPELIAEMAAYVKAERQKAVEAIYTKHPELAPEGWAEDRAVERQQAVAEEAIDVEAEDIDPAAPGPDDDPDDMGEAAEIPATGLGLYTWIREREAATGYPIIRHITAWAKLEKLVKDMEKWDHATVGRAYAEAVRKINEFARDEPKADALAN